MTKKTIFDVEGIGDFNNPELLRPISEKLPSHNAPEEIQSESPDTSKVPHKQRRKTKHQSNPEKINNSKTKLPKRKPKRKWLIFIWISFIIITSVLAFMTHTIYTANNSSLSQLILNTHDSSKLVIGFLIWFLFFTLLLLISHKKSGILFIIAVLIFSNVSVFKATEIFASFQKIFDTKTETPQVLQTSTKNVLTDPFTILILGVDADDSGTPQSSSVPQSGYRSDTMILVTVNPKTHKADMVTTPRDTFLNDSCSGTVHKLTEFINGGVKCTINTIESLYSVKVDYVVQANFAAVVQVVDALGGIEVNVPDLTDTYKSWLLNWIRLGGDADTGIGTKKLNELLNNSKTSPQWCEVDSHRNPYAVCFTQFGSQTVDGEHALAFSRSRHYDSDYARGIRQTEVIRSIVQKMATPSGLAQIQPILEKLRTSYSIETNMTFQQMTDIMSYSESLSGRDTVNFQVRKYQPLGATNKTYPGSGILLYKQSVIDIRKNLAITLETSPPEPIAESEYYDTIEYPAFKTNIS